jgi:adenylate cyclase
VTDASDEWQRILTDGHRPLLVSRRVWKHVPSAPRCKVCANPFGGIGGRVVGMAGWKPSRKNPNVCARCCDRMPPGGAEIDVAVLFADIRGSTALSERTPTHEYVDLLARFYNTATEVLLRHDALIDKLIGDEAMALFIPGVAGAEYRRRAVAAAIDLVHELGNGSPNGPWLPVGIGVNAGQAFVGNVGSAVVDFTALGEPINVAARLQAAAAGGEVVVAEDLLDDLPSLLPGARHELVDVRGAGAPVPALVAQP